MDCPCDCHAYGLIPSGCCPCAPQPDDDSMQDRYSGIDFGPWGAP